MKIKQICTFILAIAVSAIFSITATRRTVSRRKTKELQTQTEKNNTVNNTVSDKQKLKEFIKQKELIDLWYDFSIEPITIAEQSLLDGPFSAVRFISENTLMMFNISTLTKYIVNVKTQNIWIDKNPDLDRNWPRWSTAHYNKQQHGICYNKYCRFHNPCRNSFEKLASEIIIKDYDFNKKASVGLVLLQNYENSKNAYIALCSTRPFTLITILKTLEEGDKVSGLTINPLGTTGVVKINGTFMKFIPLGDITKRLTIKKQGIEKLHNIYFNFTKNSTGN